MPAPFDMQKVVGSSSIIRSQEKPRRVVGAGLSRLIAEAANPMGRYGLSFSVRTCVWGEG